MGKEQTPRTQKRAWGMREVKRKGVLGKKAYWREMDTNQGNVGTLQRECRSRTVSTGASWSGHLKTGKKKLRKRVGDG